MKLVFLLLITTVARLHALTTTAVAAHDPGKRVSDWDGRMAMEFPKFAIPLLCQNS